MENVGVNGCLALHDIRTYTVFAIVQYCVCCCGGNKECATSGMVDWHLVHVDSHPYVGVRVHVVPLPQASDTSHTCCE